MGFGTVANPHRDAGGFVLARTMIALRRALARSIMISLIGVVTLAGIAACGGGNEAANKGYDPFANGAYGGSPFLAETVAQQVMVAADRRGSLLWERTPYTATAGDVSFVVQNPSPVVHQFGIEGNGVNYQSGNIAPGATIIYTMKGLPAGDYQLVCNYANHKEAGMVAALAVR